MRKVCAEQPEKAFEGFLIAKYRLRDASIPFTATTSSRQAASFEASRANFSIFSRSWP